MSNKGGCLSSMFSFLGFITGIVSFVANIVTILNGWNVPEVKVGKVAIDVPNIAIPHWMDISDMNFALAAGIYASIMLSYVAWKVTSSPPQSARARARYPWRCQLGIRKASAAHRTSGGGVPASYSRPPVRG